MDAEAYRREILRTERTLARAREVAVRHRKAPAGPGVIDLREYSGLTVSIQRIDRLLADLRRLRTDLCLAGALDIDAAALRGFDAEPCEDGPDNLTDMDHDGPPAA